MSAGAGPPDNPEHGVDFFVSYAGPDLCWAEWVTWQLRKAGYRAELDAWDWEVGENSVVRMRAAVDTAHRVIALLSPNYFADGRYTADEWSAALIKDGNGGHRLLPVQIEPCPLPRLVQPLVRVELFGVDQDEAAQRLLAAVRGGTRGPDGVPAFPGASAVAASNGRGEDGRGEDGLRPPGTLPAVWNLGPRNAGFVGRDAALAAIHDRLLAAGAPAVQALHGMGGVGKTQLAIEYAYRFAGSYDLAWWISAEEPTLIGDQYAMLAVELGLAGRSADPASAVRAVCCYLRGSARWLVVLDDAECAAAVRDWLPAGRGHVLITSRNPGWGELAAPVDVDVLDRAESVALLRTHRPALGESDARVLACALGDLPLALAQAGGFLSETGMPADQYLHLMATRVGALLDQSPPDGHPHSLVAATRLATDRLAEVDPAALALVRTGAFFAPEPIPLELLTGCPAGVRDQQQPEPAQPPELAALAATVADPIATHRSLGRIGRFGLGRVGDGGGGAEWGLRLHRLTQAVLRAQLDPGQTTTYRDYAQALLVAADPGSEQSPETWPGWARVLPHLLATEPAGSGSPRLRDLACRAAFYLSYRGDIKAARELAEHLYLGWREHLGPDHPHALRVACVLVRILVNLGPIERARELGEDTLDRCRRTLGDEHPITLQAAHYLADCLNGCGEFQRASELNADVLARRRRVLGTDHVDCYRTAHNLARDLRALGQVERARQLQEETVTHRRRVFGEDHPFTINSVNELGSSLRVLGHVELARRMHEANVHRARRALGADHKWTLDGQKKLAGDLYAAGELAAASQLCQDALVRARRALGEDSHFAIEVANQLVATLTALGEREPARRLAEDTLERSRRALGTEHPCTIRAAANLAALQ